MSFYRKLIIETTGVNDKDAAYIENIMREDIFHSTLDWQSPKIFARGAREAVAMLKVYRDDPTLSKHFPVR